jgi:hypothetical protein
MFASIRRYRLQRGSMDDLARRVDEEFAEQICAQSGFVSYEFMECGEGQIMTVSMFAESEQADGSRDLARRWTEQRLRDIEFSTLDAMGGEVLVSRASRDMLEAGHPAATHRFGAVRRYRLRGGSIGELMHRVDESLADRMAAIDGVEAYHALDCGGGDLLSMTFVRNRALERQTDDMARQFVGEHLADAEIERTETISGEVIVSRAMAQLLEPAHA